MQETKARMNETLEDFDAIIVGAGQAGPPLAARLAGAGQRVVIVERHLIGGTCLNVGCTPTKTMIASAYAAHLARRGSDFGVHASGPVTVDLAAVQQRARDLVEPRRRAMEESLSGIEGCEIVRGHARFVGPREIVVGERRLRAHKVFLDVGGRASAPQWPGLGDVPWLSSTDMLSLKEMPRHLAVIGGGYVGLEFAQMYRRFGAEVTIVEKGPALVKREDLVVSAEIQAILEDEGVAVRTRAECIRVSPHADGVAVSVDCASGNRQIMASHVLLALGRTPNTDDLSLEAAGIKTDARGFVVVDDWLRTSAAGVWALGDCNGRGAFTHTSYGDADMVAANMLDGETRSLRDRVSAYALYIDPPLGRAGMTENEARAAGHRIRVGERRMDHVSRAVEKSEGARGLMRVVVDADDDRILGAAILGPGGDEAISSIVMAIGCGAKAADLRRLTGIHPTVAELLPTLAGELGPVLDRTTAAP
jgi:pyruvate/2-oxoglutarate dehydrogenase complex dihydrolipoamide dehydrogenase (E3) component